MRLAITIGRIGDDWEFIGKPGEAQAQKELFRAIRGKDGKYGTKEFHEVRTFSSDGAMNYRHVFDSAEQKRAHAKRRAADLKIYEAAKKARESGTAMQEPAQTEQSKAKRAAADAVVAQQKAGKAPKARKPRTSKKNSPPAEVGEAKEITS